MNKIIRLLFNKGSYAAYGLMTAVFTIVPEDVFKVIVIFQSRSEFFNLIINKLIICILIYLICIIFYSLYCRLKNKVMIKEDNYIIQIEYGDLLNISDGKKVINFDECFTTKVGELPSEIKSSSICGQYLLKYPIEDIDKLIDQAGISVSKTKSKYNKQTCYEPGTIIPNGEYLLMAFAKLNKDGVGYLSYDDYVKCLDKLWGELDLYHGSTDVYVPILGSHITRFDKELNQQQLLDIMIYSYRLSSKKIKSPYVLHIVCKHTKGFSINNVLGAE